MAKAGSVSISRNSYSIENNTSNITVTGIITTSGDSWRGNQRSGTVTVTQGGTTIYSDSFTSGAPQNSTTTLFSVSLTVYHNTDGSSGRIEASYNYDSGWCAGSGYLDLPTIPRVSVPTLNGSLFTITKTNINFIRIYTNRKADFTHHIYYSFNGESEIGLTSGVTDYYDWYFPSTLAEKIPGNYKVSGYIRLYTFNGGTNLGSRTVAFQMQLSDEFIPTVTIDVADLNGYADIYGKYIQGRSAVKVSAEAAGCSGSSIRSYSTIVDGKTYSGAEVTSDLITSGENLTVTTTVTDSRERTGNAKAVIPVYPYVAPKISALTAKRCNADGTLNSGGSHLAVMFSAEVTSLDSKNTAVYILKYHKKGETAEETVELTDYANTYKHTDTVYVIPAEPTKSYEITLYIADAFAVKYGSTYKRTIGSTVSKLWSWLHKGLGMAVGKIAELEGVFDIAFRTRFEGGILQPVLAAETDLNDVKTPNSYTGLEASTAGYVNIPITEGRFTLEVLGANPDEAEDKALTQRLTCCVKEKSLVYERHYYGDAWGAWVMATLGYTPVQQGTGVGQLGNAVKIGWSGSRLKATVDVTDLGNFVFDDSVCSKGDDGNGNKSYRFPDGTLICTKAVSVSVDCSSTWGSGLYDSPAIDLGSWPSAFASTPATTITFCGGAGSGYGIVEGLNGTTATSAGTTYLCRGTQGAVAGNIHVIGIGRWK